MLTSRGSEWNRWDLHVHTASSYDYKYKGNDADELLCASLKNNNVKAVAITDHFTIDKNRIGHLRSIANGEIVFFPGVELRTDKGSNNLHLILIFSETSNLEELSADFDSQMKRDKAKSKDSDETIYWEFHDIIDFAKKHDALITIHAGKKANGIDKISNAIPVNEAIKSDIASDIHFFEIGRLCDVDDYEKHVFKSIKRKPLILCSDNHNPSEYSTKENLWIKADFTFQGLKQCVYQPQERVFLGVIPPVLDRVNKNTQNTIASISCSRISEPRNKESRWFNFTIPINPSMVAVIGNKGSGKSAFSDMIGCLCCCATMESASFLNNKRFRQPSKNYANDYLASLTWKDGETKEFSLSDVHHKGILEYAQYLPQKYIEDVCNEFGDAFQKEIDNVIFSYVDQVERGDAHTLSDLVELKSKSLVVQANGYRQKLSEINGKIIKLEGKKTTEYKAGIERSLKSAQEQLSRHEHSRPIEVKKPEQVGQSAEYQSKLAALNVDIKTKQNEINDVNQKIAFINNFIDELQVMIAKLTSLEASFFDVKVDVDGLRVKYGISDSECSMEIKTPRIYLEKQVTQNQGEKNILQTKISNEQTGLATQLNKLMHDKETLIASADGAEKAYQKYLVDLAEWEEKQKSIIGTKEIEGSIEYCQSELNYISNKLDSDYKSLIENRDEIVRNLYNGIIGVVRVYQEIYSPVQGEIQRLLGDLEDGIEFQAEVFMKEHDVSKKIIDFINKRFTGRYGSGEDGILLIESKAKEIDFNNSDSVVAFVNKMGEVITSDFDTADKRVAKRQEFYDFVFGLDYVNVNFKLKMGGRSLEELSPGERGIVLLIFYLALSKESKPIIIDQPEDNLDNQSVYSKLVPCICKAKQKRQVIMVTHNPNIAMACDAEQIVYCKKVNGKNEIRYESGSIENQEIRNHVVDVLEGTMPAFELRRHKYN